MCASVCAHSLDLGCGSASLFLKVYSVDPGSESAQYVPADDLVWLACMPSEISLENVLSVSIGSAGRSRVF